MEERIGEGKIFNYNKAIVAMMLQHRLIVPGDEEQVSNYLAMTE